MMKKPTEKLKTLPDQDLATAEHDRMLQWVYRTAQQHVDLWFKRTAFFEKEFLAAVLEYNTALHHIQSEISVAAQHLDATPEIQQRMQEKSGALLAFLEDDSSIPPLPIDILQPNIAEKELQKPLHGERKGHIAGFMDIMVRVGIPKTFHLTMQKVQFMPFCSMHASKEEQAMRTYQKYGSMELQKPTWEVQEKRDISLCVDVRSAVPSLGQLTRELSTLCCLASDHTVCVVLPDNTHAEILREQGYLVLVAPVASQVM